MNLTPCCSTHADELAAKVDSIEEKSTLLMRMFLCEKCGNKRCPRATLCELDCTGSNNPGQPGSSYTQRDEDIELISVTKRQVACLIFTAGMSRFFNVYNMKVQALVIKAAEGAQVPLSTLYGERWRTGEGGAVIEQFITSYEPSYCLTLESLLPHVDEELSGLIAPLLEGKFEDKVIDENNALVHAASTDSPVTFDINKVHFETFVEWALSRYGQRNGALPCVSSMTHNLGQSQQQAYREGMESLFNRRMCGNAIGAIKQLLPFAAEEKRKRYKNMM